MMQQRHDGEAAPAPSRRLRRRPGQVALTLVVALSLGAAACSSGSSYDKATAGSDINSVYKTVFDLANPSLDPKIAAIQDGSQIKASFNAALTSSLAKSSAGAKMDSYEILSSSGCTAASVPSPCAKVVYDIDGPTGTAILPNSKGYAVYLNGKWLVAKATICGLLGLFYTAAGKQGSPKGC
jgi:hypothetical protein